MANTTFEQLQAVLKAHPNAKLVVHPRRGRPHQPKGPGLGTQPQAKYPAGIPSQQREPGDPGNSRPPDLERHQRKCRICRHPDRDLIELDFLRWQGSRAIAETYGLPHHSAICRHARAVGLFERRDQTIHYALEPILEQADSVLMRLTPATLVSAVAAYSKINDDGKRIRQPRINNIYFIGSETAPGQKPTGPHVSPEEILANREIQKLVRQITR
jgi:hypothetical protein